jgi:hypothetical protein
VRAPPARQWSRDPATGPARPRRSPWLGRAVWLTVLLLAGLARPAPGARVESELDLRCAYLFNFARFTTWPQDAFPSATSPFTFAVLGDHELAVRLQGLLEGKRIDSHPLAVVEPTAPADCGSAQVVYVGAERRKSAGDILAACRGHAILTVSEIPSFLRQGGMVLIVPVDENLRFDINQSATAGSGLRVSSRLLQLARTVGGGGP